MTYPVFASGDVLNASDMNGVGLWLVKSQAVGTGVGSVTVTGAFSADYDNYKVFYSGGSGSTGHVMLVQLKLGGGGVAGTSYFSGMSGATYSNSPVTVGLANVSSVTYGGGGEATGFTAVDMTIIDPFKTVFTKFSNSVWFATYAATNTAVHAELTSYTDLVLTPSSGTLTGGTVRIYGYRN